VQDALYPYLLVVGAKEDEVPAVHRHAKARREILARRVGSWSGDDPIAVRLQFVDKRKGPNWIVAGDKVADLF